MNQPIVITALVLALLSGVPAAWAHDGVQTAGSVIDVTLLSAAAAATFGHHDGVGTRQLALSLGVTWTVTLVLKRAINETRPDGGAYSFPSGHSSSSFTSAEFMRRRYGWKWGAPFYALATFVAYSRVESKMHYTHDVIAGAAIGVASSFIFTKPRQSWTAAVSGDAHGAQFTFSRIW